MSIRPFGRTRHDREGMVNFELKSIFNWYIEEIQSKYKVTELEAKELFYEALNRKTVVEQIDIVVKKERPLLRKHKTKQDRKIDQILTRFNIKGV